MILMIRKYDTLTLKMQAMDNVKLDVLANTRNSLTSMKNAKNAATVILEILSK